MVILINDLGVNMEVKDNRGRNPRDYLNESKSLEIQNLLVGGWIKLENRHTQNPGHEVDGSRQNQDRHVIQEKNHRIHKSNTNAELKQKLAAKGVK